MLEVVHTLEEPDKQCPRCGGALAEMKGCYEEAEEVDVVQRRFVLKRHKRQKYRCGCGGCVETALGPPRLQPGGRYSVDFAVEVATSKYLDHLPLGRQVRVMAREGLVADSQTLWDQIDALARVLAPAHEACVLPSEPPRPRTAGAGGEATPAAEGAWVGRCDEALVGRLRYVLAHGVIEL